MNRVIIAMMVCVSAVSVAEEVCLTQEKYENTLEMMEAVLQLKVNFEGELNKLELITAIRSQLDSNQTEAIEFIDSISDSLLSVVTSGIEMVEPEIFQKEYHRRLVNLAEAIDRSRKKITAETGSTELQILVEKLGITN